MNQNSDQWLIIQKILLPVFKGLPSFEGKEGGEEGDDHGHDANFEV